MTTPLEKRMFRSEADIYNELFTNVLPVFQEYLKNVDAKETKVIVHKSPEEMKEIINYELPEISVLEVSASNQQKQQQQNDGDAAKVQIGNNAAKEENVSAVAAKEQHNSGDGDLERNYSVLVGEIKKVLDFSCKVSNPRFMDKMYTGSEAIGVLAEALRALLNTNIHVYSVCPVFAVLEVQIVRQLCTRFIGYPEDSHDGIMCPGGAFSNMLAMNVARNIKFPATKLHGYDEETKKLAIFTSVQSHYSIAKSASVLGLGIYGVTKIASDKCGRMIAAELEKAIQTAISEGKKPFFINATAGTTVLGAFDPLEEIASIANKYNCWLHVDASWGGSLLVSDKHRHKLVGIDKADSLTWNPHKALRMPHQTTFLMMRHKHALRESNNLDAQYLFKEDPYGEAEFDVGTKTIMCGRNPDILKFWLTWLFHGRQGLEFRINKAIENANLFVQLLKKRPERFQLIHDQPEFANVGFFYFTPTVRALPQGSQEWKDALNKLAPVMYRQMRVDGNIMVSTAPLPDGTPFFWRIIILNEKLTEKDLEFILDEFERIGEKC